MGVHQIHIIRTNSKSRKLAELDLKVLFEIANKRKINLVKES